MPPSTCSSRLTRRYSAVVASLKRKSRQRLLQEPSARPNCELLQRVIRLIAQIISKLPMVGY